MTAFENRERFQTFEEAKKVVDEAVGWISHILINEDGTYSVMSHINCEFCVYCNQQKLAYKLGMTYYNIKTLDRDHPFVHVAIEDPYDYKSLKEIVSSLDVFDPYAPMEENESE